MTARAKDEKGLGAGVWRHSASLSLVLIAANVAAWSWAWRAFGDQAALLGTATLAWVFGLRHAVDADHIAAIDNVVRKLMQDGRRPVAVGFFFSLGHSTVVVLASLAVAAVTVVTQSQLKDLSAIGSVIGTSVSAAFLLVIALVNVVILRGVWRTFRTVARGKELEVASSLDTLVVGGVFMARLCRPICQTISRSRQMYPIGFLFGLGFGTATEVGLLGIAAAQAAQGMSPWQTLVFPTLFTTGMALVDTADSVLMVCAYGWAFVQPLRKLWYNLTITAASVLVALFIGGIEVLNLLADRFGLHGGFWSIASDLNADIANFGFALIALYLLAWGISAIVYRWNGYDRLAPTLIPTE